MAIGIIAILSTLSIVYINPSLQLKRARDNQRLAEIKQLQSALEQYKGDKGLYPAFGSVSSPNYGSWGIGSIFLNSAGGSSGAIATVTYLRNIPTGPNTGGNMCKGYFYSVNKDATTGITTYTIFVKLEDGNNSYAIDTKPIPASPLSGGTLALDKKTYTANCNGVSTIFNYWVNNP